MPNEPQEPAPSYFEFDPVELPVGKYTTPRLGEVVPGKIYEVRAKDAINFTGHPDWKKSSLSKFTAQDKEQ